MKNLCKILTFFVLTLLFVCSSLTIDYPEMRIGLLRLYAAEKEYQCNFWGSEWVSDEYNGPNKIGSYYFYGIWRNGYYDKYFSSDKKGTDAYKIASDKSGDIYIGDEVYCNDKYIIYTVCNEKKQTQSIYRLAIKDKKRTLIKKFKAVDYVPIITIYNNKLFYKQTPKTELEKSSKTYIKYIDLTDKNFTVHTLDTCVGLYENNETICGKYLWQPKAYNFYVYRKQDDYGGHNVRMYAGDVVYAVYDMEKAVLCNEINISTDYQVKAFGNKVIFTCNRAVPESDYEYIEIRSADLDGGNVEYIGSTNGARYISAGNNIGHTLIYENKLKYKVRDENFNESYWQFVFKTGKCKQIKEF